MDIKRFNPKNVASWTQEDYDLLLNATPDQIQELAKAYPHDSATRPYIHLRDKTKKDGDQLFPVSTFAGLADLHRIGQTQYVAVSARGVKKAGNLKTAQVQDLSAEEAAKELSDSKLTNGRQRRGLPRQSTEGTAAVNGTEETAKGQIQMAREVGGEDFASEFDLDENGKIKNKEEGAEVVNEKGSENASEKEGPKEQTPAEFKKELEALTVADLSTKLQGLTGEAPARMKKADLVKAIIKASKTKK